MERLQGVRLPRHVRDATREEHHATQRLLAVAAAIVGAVVGATTLTASAHASFDGYYEIVNDHARKCVDVAGAANSVGAVVFEWDCHNGNNQLWLPVQEGNGYFHLVERNNPFGPGQWFCLTVGGPNNGAGLYQALCDNFWNDPTQMWRWEGNGIGQWLVSAYGKCLALSPNTSANGTSIIIDDCSDTTAKYWHYG
jgi:hypothetical protein